MSHTLPGASPSFANMMCYNVQTLGLSDSTPRSESRLRSLLWPTIRTATDLDYITRQGFWICVVVAVTTTIFTALSGSTATGVFEGLFFFLAGIGVRERNRAAGIAAFTAYLLSALVLQRYTGNGFGIVRIIFLALLFANIRGNWLSAHWKDSDAEAPPRLTDTFFDKLADQLPTILWPKVRIVFYLLAGAEIALLLVALFAPLPA